MKFLADENFPPSLISALQKKRHDVKRIRRVARGISDASVRVLAKREKPIVITFDSDLLTTKPEEERVSVMLFYFPQLMPEEILPYLDRAIDAIRKYKKKKRPFTLIYSEEGIEVVETEEARKS